MARGRMLNKSISASRKFHLLPDDTCRLLATWTLAHLDRNGVFYGDPVIVKSLVFPRRGDVTSEQVEVYLGEMVKAGLIILFEADGQVWQYWPGFADNQPNLRTDREKTDFPPPVVKNVAESQQEISYSNTPMPEKMWHNAGKNVAESQHDTTTFPVSVQQNTNESNLNESNLKELLLPPPWWQ